MKTPTLTLDRGSISPESLSMPALMRELNLQRKPSWILSALMNALERKRQARGLGWSRAWNKVGMNIFRTHALDPGVDEEFVSETRRVLHAALCGAPEPYCSFVDDLLDDEKCMGFIFYHNHITDDGRQWEGLTASFGRKVVSEPSKRDRIDLILEDERVGDSVDGMVDRIRVYACPWSKYGGDRSFHQMEVCQPGHEQLAMFQPYYRKNVDLYQQWKADETRQWSHWSVRYIDYFGARQFIPQGSSFI